MTLRVITTLAVIVCVAGTVQARQRSGRGTTAPAKAKATAEVRQAGCASPLGQGVKNKKQYCDVIIAATGAESVSLQIPPHTGASTLYFDLHPRFELNQPDANSAAAFQIHWPVVAVVGPDGDVIDRAAANGEYRSPADLDDRIAGQGPGGFKVVGPGKATTVKITIPASISSVGIVGLRVEIANRYQKLAYPEPGRPVAIVSNWRIVYTPK